MIDAVITVVDAKHITQHLDEQKPEGVENESVEQIAFADRILLNKTDLVSEQELLAVEKRIKSINGGVQIIRTQLRASDGRDAAIDLNAILNVDAFNLQKILESEPDFLSEAGHEHEHDKAVGSVGFKFPAEMNLGKLQKWISTMMQEKGPDLYRYKVRPVASHVGKTLPQQPR
jgi:G3E family GTPase